jgi:adenosylcobinamide-GDP ribazoletransferase
MKMARGVSLRKISEEFGLALGLLTRFPLPTFETRTEASVGSAFWAYPLAGALIGAVAAAVFFAASAIGFTTLVSALLTIAISILVSGGFHEDGLSDFWDGLGGGKTKEDKLTIMRDSRVGTYGALALYISLSLQTALLTSLYQYAGLGMVAGALVGAEITARGAIALPVALLEPAREDGLGRSLTDLSRNTLIIGVLIAIIVPAGLLGLPGIALAAGAAVGAAFITLLAGHFLEGYTGDVLGATVTTARLAGLGALALLVTP